MEATAGSSMISVVARGRRSGPETIDAVDVKIAQGAVIVTRPASGPLVGAGLEFPEEVMLGKAVAGRLGVS